MPLPEDRYFSPNRQQKEIAQRLYSTVANLPLVCPHGHVDPRMFVETSSYGHRAVDSVLRVLGVDMLVFGSDRPYAQPRPDLGLGDAARHAIRVTNPARLLHGDRLPPEAGT